MTPLVKKLMFLYLAALLGYAALGAANQGLFARQQALMADKQTQLDAIVELRGEAAGITGALAVRDWALGHGMIAYTEAAGAGSFEVYPIPAPIFVLPQSGLEIRTTWR